MSFGRSIMTILAATLAIGFPYFVGYGLALHQTMPMLVGGGFLLASAALVFLLSRAGGEAGSTGH